MLPGLPARSVKKVSKKSPNTNFVVFLTHFRVIWDCGNSFLWPGKILGEEWGEILYETFWVFSCFMCCAERPTKISPQIPPNLSLHVLSRLPRLKCQNFISASFWGLGCPTNPCVPLVLQNNLVHAPKDPAVLKTLLTTSIVIRYCGNNSSAPRCGSGPKCRLEPPCAWDPSPPYQPGPSPPGALRKEPRGVGGRGKERAGREGVWLEGRVLQLHWGMGGTLQTPVGARPTSGGFQIIHYRDSYLDAAFSLRKVAANRHG